MLIDKFLTFSDAQAVTATAGSTDYLDAKAAGDAIQSGIDLYLNIRVHTLPVSGAASTAVFTFETDDEITFTAPTVLWTSASFLKAALGANTYPVQIPLPRPLKRYSRVNYTIGTADYTAGKFDAFISSGVDVKRPVS